MYKNANKTIDIGMINCKYEKIKSTSVQKSNLDCVGYIYRVTFCLLRQTSGRVHVICSHDEHGRRRNPKFPCAPHFNETAPRSIARLRNCCSCPKVDQKREVGLNYTCNITLTSCLHVYEN